MTAAPFLARVRSRLTDEEDPLVVTAWGVLAPTIATAMQLAIWPFIPPSPQLLFYPAVFASSYGAGARGGFIATGASALAMAYWFLPPEHALRVLSAGDALDLVLFVAVAAAVSFTMGRLRAALRRERAAADAARAAREATEATWALVAHDLRNPLSSISLGSGHLVGRLHAGASDLEHAARIIQRSAVRARTLIDEAIDTMKLADGALTLQLATCEVSPLFARVVEDLATIAANAGVHVDADVRTYRPVRCDAARIAHVLTNLVSNAVRFTPRDGRVEITADDEGDAVRIAVKDSGTGIATEDLPSIFAKYWSKGVGGSGLGLWMCKGIVEAHGHTIAAESREGEGSTFSFRLSAVVDGM